MNNTKEIWFSGLALFSMFFGAGNLILPSYLGVLSGNNWFWVLIGFCITAVIIPILGVLAHARVQGSLFDLAKPVNSPFGICYCVIIYLIAVTLPAPRTASVTYEMAIAPFFEISNLLSSSIYFLLVFLFVINRSRILNLLGKFLTPFIILILVVIILKAMQTSHHGSDGVFENAFVSGFLEGYQTFDAIGGVVVGAVIVISLQLKGYDSYKSKRQLITKSGLIAGCGLLLIYGGLIFTGSVFKNSFELNTSRTEVLKGISNLTLGSIGASFLSVLVALACFTTAVGIITGTSDYVRGICKNSKKAYYITAFLSCFIGVLIGQLNVSFIISIAVPVLLFIYPITIILILLNVFPKKYASNNIFKWVVFTTFIFSIPDFLSALHLNLNIEKTMEFIPFGENQMGWVIPSLLVFIISNLLSKKNTNFIQH